MEAFHGRIDHSRHLETGHKEEQPCKKRDQVGIEHDLADRNIAAAAHENIAVDPHEQVEGQLKACAVKGHFVAEHHGDYGEHEIAYVGKHERAHIHGIEAQGLSQQVCGNRGSEHAAESEYHSGSVSHGPLRRQVDLHTPKDQAGLQRID